MNGGGLAFLRLLQVADSAFPTGAYAYSHGLEWLARESRPGERELQSLCSVYVDQVLGGQLLPALLAARGASLPAIRRIDTALDVSIVAETERFAGRAIGERLLHGALDAFAAGPGDLAPVRAYAEAAARGETPGQHAVAFGMLTDALDVPAEVALPAFAMGAMNSLVQAAVRLNLIGQSAAGRIQARAAERLDEVLPRVLSAPRRSRFGAFAPGLEVAAILQPTLQFRMFAS